MMTIFYPIVYQSWYYVWYFRYFLNLFLKPLYCKYPAEPFQSTKGYLLRYPLFGVVFVIIFFLGKPIISFLLAWYWWFLLWIIFFNPLNSQSHIHLQQLWDHMMILFINIMIITLLPFLCAVLWMIK